MIMIIGNSLPFQNVISSLTYNVSFISSSRLTLSLPFPVTISLYISMYLSLILILFISLSLTLTLIILSRSLSIPLCPSFFFSAVASHSLFLKVYLSIYPSIPEIIFHSLHQFLPIAFYLLVYNLSRSLSLSLSLSINLSRRLSLFLCLSLRLYLICLCIYLSIIYLSLSLISSTSLSTYPFIYQSYLLVYAAFSTHFDFLSKFLLVSLYHLLFINLSINFSVSLSPTFFILSIRFYFCH